MLPGLFYAMKHYPDPSSAFDLKSGFVAVSDFELVFNFSPALFPTPVSLCIPVQASPAHPQPCSHPTDVRVRSVHTYDTFERAAFVLVYLAEGLCEQNEDGAVRPRDKQRRPARPRG
ncbi:hypothetical protein EVAR_51270_1 [Eumeta japonica]|uniref:Uncharacterized protein n=1 Tax=Eumeta variegata TaxID=151549 RepID=A0A4C1Y6Z9_EUMVA|nr:hypothetical protein EVAR_51270_1 [Eumeta japonica]